MRKSSRGAAIWVMYWTSDACKVISIGELVDRFYGEGYTKSKKRVNPVVMMRTLLDAKVPLYYVIQRPGDLVVSPASTRGAAHMVFSYGELQQTAWNHSFCIEAWRECLRLYSGFIDDRNSGAATRLVLPCLRIQHLLGFDLGLKRELEAHLATIHLAEQNGMVSNVIRIDSPPVHCGYIGKDMLLLKSCGHSIDLAHYAVFCYDCFIKFRLPVLAEATPRVKKISD